MNKLISFFAALIIVAGLSLPTMAMDVAMPDHPVVININQADAETLTELKGVGPKLAHNIVAWREANGEFSTLDQLLEIKGIGPKFLAKNKSNLTLK